MQVGRRRVRGELVIVCYEKETFVFVLHPDRIFNHSEIIAQMQVAGGAYAANYCIHLYIRVSMVLSVDTVKVGCIEVA